MDEAARLEYLEEKVLEQAEASRATADTLARILAKLNDLEIGRTPVSNPRSPAPAPAPVTVIAPTPLRIKPGIPPNFDGDRTLGRAFVTSCLLYFSLCPADFTDEQTKIHWVLSYLKSGRAAIYTDCVLRTELRTFRQLFADWDAFYAQLRQDLLPEERGHTFAHAPRKRPILSGPSQRRQLHR